MLDNTEPQISDITHLSSFSRQFLPEIWAIILSFLLDRSDIKNCSLINRQLNHLALPFIWARFTLHLYHIHGFDLNEHLSTITDNPHRARCISDLRIILFSEAGHESPPMTTASMLTSVHQGKRPTVRNSTTPTMIGNIFNLLDNVKYLTVIPASRSSLARFPPPFADGSAPIDGPGKEQLFRTMRPVEEPVLDILEGWLGSSPSDHTSTGALTSGARTRFTDRSKSSRSPPGDQNSPSPVSITLGRPPVRNLRTTVHLAKTFLSSVSPTHTLVLIDGDSNGGNIAVGDRLRDTRSPVQILQTESYYTLTSMMTDIWRSGPCPNLKIMVDVSHGQEGWGPLYNDKYPLRGLCRAFRMHPSIHTCVLRTVLYSRSLWEGSDIPRAFELDLSSRMAKLEGRSPPPRVIVELGTLGKPDFICWIFTMVSKDRWTRQKEEHPILDLMEREDLLYLSAGAQGGPADPALWDREDEHIVFSDDEDSDDGWW